ncbi:MAG: hypothetical protein ACFCUQ_11765 [Kiloniellales bacterium]
MSGAGPTVARRVLFLTHNQRHDYLKDLVAHAQRSERWRLGILSQYDMPSYYADLDFAPEDLFVLPDLGRPADWERDPDQSERVWPMIATCERQTGVPIHRIVLAGERTMGRGYARRFYHWPATAILKRALRDNSEPARMAARLFAFIDGVLDRFRPDLIVAGQAASPDGYVLAVLAETRGIPLLINRPSKILSGRCFWTTDRGMLNTAAEALYAERAKAGAAPGQTARAHLERFRETPKTVAYIRRNWDLAASRTWLRRHRNLAIMAAGKAKWWLTGRKSPEPNPPFARAWEFYRTAFLAARQRRLFATLDEAELAPMRYVLMALHKEPELAINVQNPQWHSQQDLVAQVSANLPAGYRLLVRDHRFNEGRRPMAYLRDLAGLPGVVLISPVDPQFKYIRNAELIVSDNGTTGWEGLIFGKRVVSVGRNYYQCVGLAEQVSDPSRLGDVFIRRLAESEVSEPEEWDRRLALYIEAEAETTVPEDAAAHSESIRMLAELLRPLADKAARIA